MDESHCCEFEAGWPHHTQQWWTSALWGWKPSYFGGQVCLGIIVDMWSHAFGNFTKVTNKVAVFTTTWKREKGLFQAGHKTSLGLSRALWMKATVVNLRLAGPHHTQQWWTSALWGWKPSYFEGQVCLKRLACSGPSHGWVCLTGLYWLGKDSGLGGWYSVVQVKPNKTFGLQWTKGGMWTSCQWQSKSN